MGVANTIVKKHLNGLVWITQCFRIPLRSIELIVVSWQNMKMNFQLLTRTLMATFHCDSSWVCNWLQRWVGRVCWKKGWTRKSGPHESHNSILLQVPPFQIPLTTLDLHTLVKIRCIILAAMKQKAHLLFLLISLIAATQIPGEYSARLL